MNLDNLEEEFEMEQLRRLQSGYEGTGGICNDHLTLGALLEHLDNSDKPVYYGLRYDCELLVPRFYLSGDLTSYRGYYTDVALDVYAPEKCMVYRPCLEYDLKESIKKGLKKGMMMSWKSGYYPLTKECPVWISAKGECSGLAVCHVERREEDGCLYLGVKLDPMSYDIHMAQG